MLIDSLGALNKMPPDDSRAEVSNVNSNYNQKRRAQEKAETIEKSLQKQYGRFLVPNAPSTARSAQ